jgi:hypothetical protein
MVLLTGLAPAAHAKLKDPQKLVSFLQIELPGWKVKEGFPKLEKIKGKAGAYVESQVVYTSGKSKVTAVIMEGPGISPEVAEVRKFPLSDDEAGYCRKTTVQGFEAVELYGKTEKKAFLFIFIAPNCMIPMRAEEVGSAKVLRDLANEIDLPGLAAAVK